MNSKYLFLILSISLIIPAFSYNPTTFNANEVPIYNNLLWNNETTLLTSIGQTRFGFIINDITYGGTYGNTYFNDGSISCSASLNTHTLVKFYTPLITSLTGNYTFITSSLIATGHTINIQVYNTSGWFNYPISSGASQTTIILSGATRIGFYINTGTTILGTSYLYSFRIYDTSSVGSEYSLQIVNPSTSNNNYYGLGISLAYKTNKYTANNIPFYSVGKTENFNYNTGVWTYDGYLDFDSLDSDGYYNYLGGLTLTSYNNYNKFSIYFSPITINNNLMTKNINILRLPAISNNSINKENGIVSIIFKEPSKTNIISGTKTTTYFITLNKESALLKSFYIYESDFINNKISYSDFSVTRYLSNNDYYIKVDYVDLVTTPIENYNMTIRYNQYNGSIYAYSLLSSSSNSFYNKYFYFYESSSATSGEVVNTGWKAPQDIQETELNYDTRLKNNDGNYSSLTLDYSYAMVLASATTFNFNIPTGSTIVGIEGRIKGYQTGMDVDSYIELFYTNELRDITDTITYATKDNTLIRMEDDDTASTYFTIGSSNDLWGATNYTAEQINDVVWLLNSNIDLGGAESFDLFIDSVELKIYYINYTTTTTTRLLSEYDFTNYAQGIIIPYLSSDSIEWGVKHLCLSDYPNPAENIINDDFYDSMIIPFCLGWNKITIYDNSGDLKEYNINYNYNSSILNMSLLNDKTNLICYSKTGTNTCNFNSMNKEFYIKTIHDNYNYTLLDVNIFCNVNGTYNLFYSDTLTTNNLYWLPYGVYQDTNQLIMIFNKYYNYKSILSLDNWLKENSYIVKVYNEYDFTKFLMNDYVKNLPQENKIFYVPSSYNCYVEQSFNNNTLNISFKGTYSLLDAIKFSPIINIIESNCSLGISNPLNPIEDSFRYLNYGSCLFTNFISDNSNTFYYITFLTICIIISKVLLGLFK